MTLPEFEDSNEQPRPKLRLVVLGARTGSRPATVADLRAQLGAMTAEERHEVWETAFPREIELLSERDELSARLVEDNHALRRVEDANAALQDERDRLRAQVEELTRERDEARAGESSAMRRVGELADASPEGQGVTVGTTEAEVTRGIKVALMAQVMSLRSRCTNQRRELRRLNAALSRFRGPLRKISWEGSGLTRQRLISALLRRYDSLSPKAAGEAIDDFLLRSGGATIDAWRPVVEAAIAWAHAQVDDRPTETHLERAVIALPPEHRPKPDPGTKDERRVPRWET